MAPFRQQMSLLCQPEAQRDFRSGKYLAPQTGFEVILFRFYKKGCQEKKLSRELEAAKSFGIQPPCHCAGPRGVGVRGLAVKRRDV